MPFSSPNGKNWIKQILPILHNFISLNNVLDVGAGVGTYSSIIKKINENCHIEAVEIWEPYIEKYDLKKLYNVVHQTDIREFDYDDKDLIIFGDVLEHMTKEEAQAVVQNAAKKAKFVLISLPIGYYPQDEYEDNPYEVHVTDHWTMADVMETFYGVRAYHLDNEIGVFLITEEAEFVSNVHKILHEFNKLRINAAYFYEKSQWHACLETTVEYLETFNRTKLQGLLHTSGELYCYHSLALYYTDKFNEAYNAGLIATLIEPENDILQSNLKFFEQELATRNIKKWNVE